MRNIILLIMGLLISFISPSFADDEGNGECRDIPQPVGRDVPEISEAELLAIIDRSDAFFRDQGIENIAVDLRLFRDPANVLSLEDLRTGTVDARAPFSPIIAHYFYQAPGWYQLKIMGILIACSEGGVTAYTNLLPLPGGQLDIPEVMDNYNLIYLGKGEVNGRVTHRVRFVTKDFKKEFIKYSIYEFDAEGGYVSRVESHFDDGYWRGHGFGEFYYKERKGKMLPAYGYGEIYILPFFKTALWGRWDDWEFNSPDFARTLGRGQEEKFKPIEVDTK